MSRRALRRVLYDLSEWEADVLADPGSASEHTIDREMPLEFDDGAQLRISWCKEPVQWCIGISTASFFLPIGNVLVDASDHINWRELIGGRLSYCLSIRNIRFLSGAANSTRPPAWPHGQAADSGACRAISR
jgi:hypothetical protein